MLKRLKSVSMLLFLMGTTTGAAYAVPVSTVLIWQCHAVITACNATWIEEFVG